MISVVNLIESASRTSVKIEGQWYPSRPLRCCFWHRLRDAWYVLAGKCDAVKWPHQ